MCTEKGNFFRVDVENYEGKKNLYKVSVYINGWLFDAKIMNESELRKYGLSDSEKFPKR